MCDYKIILDLSKYVNPEFHIGISTYYDDFKFIVAVLYDTDKCESLLECKDEVYANYIINTLTEAYARGDYIVEL